MSFAVTSPDPVCIAVSKPRYVPPPVSTIASHGITCMRISKPVLAPDDNFNLDPGATIHIYGDPGITPSIAADISAATWAVVLPLPTKAMSTRIVDKRTG